MDLKRVPAENPDRTQEQTEPPMPGQFDPRELRLNKRVPERSDAEKTLSQRLMTVQKSPAPPPAASSAKATPGACGRSCV
jgi:hypothetical protein